MLDKKNQRHVKAIKSGEVLFTRDEMAKSMYLLLSGEMLTGEEPRFPGDLLGEMGFLTEQNYLVDAQAVTDSILLTISQENVLEVIRDYPNMALALLRKLAQKLTPEKVGMSNNLTIFPDNHREYQQSGLDTDEQFLFTKEVACPICESEVSVKRVRNSRLRLAKVDPDFRQHYKDFNHLWYYVWVCPHCYYARPYHRFTPITPTQKSAVKKQLKEIEDKLVLGKSPDIQSVFASYYLALYTWQDICDDPAELGNLWLRIGWLYQDVDDIDMSVYAWGKALYYFEQSYYQSDKIRAQEQEQRLLILLGELCMKTNRPSEALRYYREVIKPGRAKNNYSRAAQDRIQDLRRLSTTSD